eukprot:TRINITY_DN13384_c0_g1_i1.p1 TRINITY_DN13384_c0_g1~~TRINITY_DN13384_c0_g1_i1.p1  ORF type:complete len:100 (+),score=1.06 TRINITY_DN13384_c0_g1_i1:295-594(+)
MTLVKDLELATFEEQSISVPINCFFNIRFPNDNNGEWRIQSEGGLTLVAQGYAAASSDEPSGARVFSFRAPVVSTSATLEFTNTVLVGKVYTLKVTITA